MKSIPELKAAFKKKYGVDWDLTDQVIERILSENDESDPVDYILRDMKRALQRSYQGGA